MVNNGLILDRLVQIRTSLQRLKQLAQLSLPDFSSNPDNYAVAEHHLRRALESVFDIGRHILAKQGLGRPDSYRHVITLLGAHQIIAPNFAQKILGMAGYLNRLTHGYADISTEELLSILRTKLPDFEQFYSCIQNYMNKY